jgi:hypothetical protein
MLILLNSLLLFLVFFPRVPALPTNTSDTEYTWRTAVTVAFVCLLHGLAIIFISAALIVARPHHLGNWANTLGIMATALAAIQYLPQIWMTWHLGHVGSLSIPMMLIQTPGSFVWSASLAARLGIEGWSTWGVFLVTGCLQGCLLVMGICFEIKARRAATGDAVSAPLELLLRKMLTSRCQTQLALLDTFQPEELNQRQTMKEVRMWRMKGRHSSMGPIRSRQRRTRRSLHVLLLHRPGFIILHAYESDRASCMNRSH